MPGVPTEVLNDDIKELKAETRDIRGNLDTLKAEVHGIAVGLAELRAEFRSAIGVAKWLATALTTLAVTGFASAIWWASGINSDVRNLDGRVFQIRSDLAEIRSDVIQLRTEVRGLDGRVGEIRAILTKDREPTPTKSATPPTNGKASHGPGAPPSGDPPKS